uniref:Uncharacterized protein n=1 Tax=Strongyloides stercoralis TaxID=6248 RepID=A0A0K0E214_STRER
MNSESSSDLVAKMKKIIMELQSKGVKVKEESVLSLNVKLSEIISRLRCEEEFKTPELVENIIIKYSIKKKCYNCLDYDYFSNIYLSVKREQVNNLAHLKENNYNDNDVLNGIVFSLNNKYSDYSIVDSGISTHIIDNLELL